jgi:hypothetical protein
MNDEMVVPSQNEIDSLDVLGQLNVVVLHHVRQCDHHVAFLLLSQFMHHHSCEVDEGDVLANLLIVRVESVNPLLLSQTKHADLQSILIQDLVLQPIG